MINRFLYLLHVLNKALGNGKKYWKSQGNLSFGKCRNHDTSEHNVYILQAVLAARCSYFEAMFRSFMPEDSTVNVSMLT